MRNIPGAPRDWMPGAVFGGGGSKSTPQTTTQSTSSSPWSAQQPYLKEIFSEAQNQYQSDTPQYFPGQTVAPFSPETEQAQAAIYNRATTGSPLMLAGNQSMLDTIQGRYLDPSTNPGLQGAIEAAISPIRSEYQNVVAPGIDSAFVQSGRYGPSSNAWMTNRDMAADTYLRNVGGVASNLAYNNFLNERGLQANATANAPAYAQADYYDPAQLASLGASKEAQSQALINADIERFNYEQNLPAAKLAQYGNLVSGNYGGTMTGTSTTPYFQKQGSALQGAAGGALSGAAMGTMIMPGWGTAIGAAGGAGLGAMQSK